MPTVTPAIGDLYTVRVTKSLLTNPDNVWANSYEFRTTEDTTEGNLLLLSAKLVEFEAAFHTSDVIFQRVLISTWEPDSVPYNPDVFISTTLTAIGAIDLGGTGLSLDQCLSVTRQVNSGRFGHLYYRGCLDESEVSSPAGKTILNSRSDQQTKISTALTESGFEDYIGEDGSPFQLVMINADGTQVRTVSALNAAGVAKVKTDHRWFNRTPPTP